MGMLKRKKVKKCFCVSCHFMLSFVSKCPCSQEEVGSEEACFSVMVIRIRKRMGALWYFSSMRALSFIIYSILETNKIRENAKHILYARWFSVYREAILKYLKESLVFYRHSANIANFFLRNTCF